MVGQPRDPARPWAPSPFNRLARTHAFSVAGDAMFTTAMAGLVFFSVTDLSRARWQVAAALIFTIVPLSLAAPFLGPMIDRAPGGRKWMIVALSFLRGLVCFLLVWDRQNELLMYPEFTLVLVLAQGYILARGALVPATVKTDAELVEANSKLAGISGIGAIAGGLVSVVTMWTLSKLGSDRGPDAALFFAGIVYVVSAVQAVRLPAIQVAKNPADEVETTELHSPSIVHAAVAVSVIRVVVGFITFMLAFHFKNLESTDSWSSKVGLVGSLLGAEIGFLLGAVVAPKLRRVISEEQIIMASLVAIGIAGLLTSLMGDIAGAVLLAFTVGLASNTAKQAFDSIVQRDAPDANRGRAFAKFETRFQLWWVLGALVPVAIAFPPRLGFLFIGITCVGGIAWFWVTLHRAIAESRRRPSPLAGEPVLVEPRPVSRSFIRGRRGSNRSTGPIVDTLDLDPDPTAVQPVFQGHGPDDTRVSDPYPVGVSSAAQGGRFSGHDLSPRPGSDGGDPYVDIDATAIAPLATGGGPTTVGGPAERVSHLDPPTMATPTAWSPTDPTAIVAPGASRNAETGSGRTEVWDAAATGNLFADPPVVDPAGGEPVSAGGLFGGAAPVLFDSAVWHDEDDTVPPHQPVMDSVTPTWERPTSVAGSAYEPEPRPVDRRPPVSPSLPVHVAYPDHPPEAEPSPPELSHGELDSPVDMVLAGPPDAAVPSPAVEGFQPASATNRMSAADVSDVADSARPPDPERTHSRPDPVGIDPVTDDRWSYPEPQWRDSAPQLPGLEGSS